MPHQVVDLVQEIVNAVPFSPTFVPYEDWPIHLGHPFLLGHNIPTAGW